MIHKIRGKGKLSITLLLLPNAAFQGYVHESNISCVAVAKFSKALAWLSFLRSHKRPEFEASLRRTLVLADSANYMSVGVVNE